MKMYINISVTNNYRPPPQTKSQHTCCLSYNSKTHCIDKAIPIVFRRCLKTYFLAFFEYFKFSTGSVKCVDVQMNIFNLLNSRLCINQKKELKLILFYSC